MKALVLKLDAWKFSANATEVPNPITNATATNNFFILLNQLIIEKRIMDYEDIENGKNG